MPCGSYSFTYRTSSQSGQLRQGLVLDNDLEMLVIIILRRVGLSNQIFASTYVLHMPNKYQLIAQVEAVLENWHEEKRDDSNSKVKNDRLRKLLQQEDLSDDELNELKKILEISKQHYYQYYL